MGFFILGAGLVGLALGVAVFGLSILAVHVGRTKAKRGHWPVFGVLALVGMVATAFATVSASPEGGAGPPTGDDYFNAIRAFFVMGLSPAGGAFGLLSLVIRRPD